MHSASAKRTSSWIQHTASVSDVLTIAALTRLVGVLRGVVGRTQAVSGEVGSIVVSLQSAAAQLSAATTEQVAAVRAEGFQALAAVEEVVKLIDEIKKFATAPAYADDEGGPVDHPAIQGIFRHEFGSAGLPYSMPEQLTGGTNLGSGTSSTAYSESISGLTAGATYCCM